MKILEMESLRLEEMEQLTILQTLLLIFWMICFLGRKVCERLRAWHPPNTAPHYILHYILQRAVPALQSDLTS
jgi:hypothetical protein